MGKNAFLAGFLACFLDCLAVYEVTGNTEDFNPFWELASPYYIELVECQNLPNVGFSDAGKLVFEICELVSEALQVCVLLPQSKHTILNNIDQLSEGIAF